MEKTKQYEGMIRTAMKETGGRKPVMTVGHGINVEEPHNKKLIPKDVVEGKRPITDKEDEAAVKANQRIAASDSDKFGGQGFRKLDKRAQDVVEDMHYNMGAPRMGGFKKLKEATGAGDYRRMADEIRYTDGKTKKKESPYYQQTKGRAKEHVKTLRDLADEKELGDEIKRQLER